MKKLINFFKDDEGATMPEYALMVSLIAVACIVAVTAIGGSACGYIYLCIHATRLHHDS